jgi:hypothetical protein
VNRIYIAGPYSATEVAVRINNVQMALHAARSLIDKGWAPFVPHLSHYADDYYRAIRKPLEYEGYIWWDNSFLDVCDALYYLGSSPGADAELARAITMGLPTYRRMSEVPTIEREPWKPMG